MDKAIKELENIQSEEMEKTLTDIFTKIFIQGMSLKEAVGMSDGLMEEVYGQAYRLYNSGNYQDGKELFRMLMVLNPMEPKYALGVAACDHMLKDYAKAIEGYTVCSMLEPSNPIPYYHASDCCIKMNDIPTALTFLQIVVDLTKNKPEFTIIKDRSQLMIDGLKTRNE
jgi:type III secretion system low calcium response chaperone LcrH/SycD